MEKESSVRQLFISLAISLGAGLLGSLLSVSGMRMYERMYQPPLAPPGWLFPVVWTILYILMGVAAFLVSQSADAEREKALQYYLYQLAVNVLWPVLFFRFEAYFSAFACLLLLWVLILVTLVMFWKIDSRAGKLMLPYLLWVTFAGYLNLAIALKS